MLLTDCCDRQGVDEAARSIFRSWMAPPACDTGGPSIPPRSAPARSVSRAVNGYMRGRPPAPAAEQLTLPSSHNAQLSEVARQLGGRGVGRSVKGISWSGGQCGNRSATVAQAAAGHATEQFG